MYSLFSRAATAFLALALALAASAEPKPIVVAALKGPSGIGLVRLFDELPTMPDASEARVIAVPSADLMAAKLVSGEYDVGVLPVNVAAKLYTSGISIKLAAVIGEGMVSFLTNDPSISSLADLKGKKVNVAGQAATPDYLFKRLLKGAGLDPAKDLELDYALSYPEAAAALAAGKISCAVLPEPFTTMALLAQPALRSPFDLGKLWTASTGQSSYPMTALVLSSKLTSERPQAAAAIMKACSDSISWVIANPAAAGALVEKTDLGLKAAVATKAIPKSAYAYVPARVARSSIEALLAVFMELAPASVGGRLPDDGFYSF
jgi:ABC-type nitrate/sulfonate/bicarbonate transport systems, periplasmic components